jgi:hypothetical protein
LNESHDNSEGIAVGGLASFVKSSSMDNDFCKFLIEIILIYEYI